jgi:DNA-binding CsgD family transcriptional regulator
MSHDPLTPRELEVLSLTARGRTADDIGSILNIAPRTAAIHLQSAALKLGVSSGDEAAALAIREGLIVP